MIKGIRPSLAEGGKIKIGGLGEARQSRGGGTYRVPKKFDHFLLTGTERDAAGDLTQRYELMDALVAAGYGDQDGCLRTLPILLHADEIDEVFPTTYAAYAGKKLVCRGDGETALRWEMKDGQRVGDGAEVKCPCEQLETGRCKPHGTLHCSIALAHQAIAGSVYRWRTTSIISIQQMIGSLLQIQRVCGVLSGIPLTLRVTPMTVTPTDAQGKQQTSTVYVCHIELRSKDLATVQQQILAAAQMRNAVAGELARARVEYRALVAAPASDEETADEQAEVAMEFHSSAENGMPKNPVEDAVLSILDATDAQKNEPPIGELAGGPPIAAGPPPDKAPPAPDYRSVSAAAQKRFGVKHIRAVHGTLGLPQGLDKLDLEQQDRARGIWETALGYEAEPPALGSPDWEIYCATLER